jgi:hypothetical protein
MASGGGQVSGHEWRWRSVSAGAANQLHGWRLIFATYTLGGTELYPIHLQVRSRTFVLVIFWTEDA